MKLGKHDSSAKIERVRRGPLSGDRRLRPFTDETGYDDVIHRMNLRLRRSLEEVAREQVRLFDAS